MNVLSTSRLHLRWIAPEDSDFIIELLNDPDWIANIGDRNVRTTEDALKYIEKLRTPYLQDRGFYLVTDHDHRKLGIAGIIDREGLEDPDVGFAFLPPYRGKGFAYEASRALIDKSGLTKICAIISSHNTASIGVVKKLGLTYEKNVQLKDDVEVELYVWEKK